MGRLCLICAVRIPFLPELVTAIVRNYKIIRCQGFLNILGSKELERVIPSFGRTYRLAGPVEIEFPVGFVRAVFNASSRSETSPAGNVVDIIVGGIECDRMSVVLGFLGNIELYVGNAPFKINVAVRIA